MSPSAKTFDEPWQLLDQWHSKKSTIRMIHVGAGAAGLLMAYKMKRLMTDYELVCYEKCVFHAPHGCCHCLHARRNPNVAGTWFVSAI